MSKHQSTLSVVIVSYNTKDFTKQALESLEEDLSSSKELNETEIIVVDNNSTDGSLAMLKEWKSHTSFTSTIIENKKNLGFAAANNQGIAASQSNYILLLNSDTRCHLKCCSQLVRSMTTYQAHSEEVLGILSAQLVFADQTPQPQGGHFPSLLNLFFQMTFMDDIPFLGRFLPSIQHTGLRALTHAKELYKQDWVAATAVLLHREMLNEIGGLDEGIFMYAEDIELCMRAADHGWIAAVEPNAVVTHYTSQSSSKKTAIIGELKGLLYIWAKRKPFWQIPIARLLIRLGVYLRIFVFGTIVSDTQRAEIYTEALKEVFHD